VPGTLTVLECPTRLDVVAKVSPTELDRCGVAVAKTVKP
jgi:hypothetical protein